MSITVLLRRTFSFGDFGMDGFLLFDFSFSDFRDKKMGLLAQTTTFRPLLWCTNAVDKN